MPEKLHAARPRRVCPRLVVLEDDPSIIELIRYALPPTRFELITTESVEAAIDAVEPAPDLVLVDLRLPVGSGWDFIRALRSREHLFGVPIIILTASGDEADREKSLSAGADRYIQKPFEALHLRRTVTDLLAARDDYWWSLSIPIHESKRLQELMFDPVTEVPTLAYVVQDLRALVERGEALNVFCIELEPLFRLGERVQWDSLDEIRREFVRRLHIHSARLFHQQDVTIATSQAGTSDFYCFTSASAGSVVSPRSLENAARDLLRDIRPGDPMMEEIAVFVGRGETSTQSTYAPRILYDTIRDAKNSAERRESVYIRKLTDRVIRAIQDRSITTVFQPILELQTGRVYGYEALSRGPRGTEIESPEVIFDLARDLDLVWELEALCIQNAYTFLDRVCARGALFFNLESHFIQQLHARGLEVLEPLLECKTHVVIEVTERSAIRDYAVFRRTLRDLQRLGFKVAIDDCGSGFATLESVAELKPDYLKVGHSIFQDIEHDVVRRKLVELVARVADSIGARTIAEAIETEEQWSICKDLGIEYGQGYLFAKPGPWEEVGGLQFESPALAGGVSSSS